jgi:hypothetical protein
MRFGKISALLIGSLLSTTAWSAGLTVTIGSWQQIEPGNSQNTSAEVCGTVSGGTLTGQEHVLVTVDPNSNPGEYTTLLSPSGNFCAVVRTFTGTVEASVFTPGQTTASAKVRAQIARH